MCLESIHRAVRQLRIDIKQSLWRFSWCFHLLNIQLYLLFCQPVTCPPFQWGMCTINCPLSTATNPLDLIPLINIKRICMWDQCSLCNINSCFSLRVYHSHWKDVIVVLTPKSLTQIIDELRSILLTAELSEICEQFAAEWILDDIIANLDSLQFGCHQVTVPGTIVFLALINSVLQIAVVFAFFKKRENIQERHKINSNRNSKLWSLILFGKIKTGKILFHDIIHNLTFWNVLFWANLKNFKM